MHKNFTNIKAEFLPDSEVEITGELTLEFLNECKAEAIKSLNESTSLPGFRPGKIPEDVLVKKLGEMRILEESAEVALGKEYPKIIDAAGEKKRIAPIGRPNISITKLAPGVPLEFKIRVYVEPEFELPDYKKVTSEVVKEKSEVKVEDKEVEDVLAELKKRDIKPELKEGEKLEEKVRENIEKEKNMHELEKRRIKMLEKLVKATDIAVPEVLVESELAKMSGQFRDDVERAGMKWMDYLAQINKSEEDLKKEWRDKAAERVKAELIIAKISEKEKIEPTTDEVEHEVKHLLSHYPDANPIRARLYVYSQLRNQKVLEFLETQA